MDAFAAEVQTGIDAGTFDPTDMPTIVNCLRRWHTDGEFGAWQRQSVLEYGR